MSSRARTARPFAELRNAIGSVGEVRAPQEVEEPILCAPVRAWLHGWLTEIRSPDELGAVGLQARKTALLHGPPGCGKTTLAHHLAARLGLPLVIVGPETIFGSHMGQSEGNVRSLFRSLAVSDVPCVLFMDELEALGRKRGGQDSGGGAENARQSTLTVLLRKVEEFEGFLIGATNRKEDLDPALWRRFHMQLGIELPGPEERFAIMRRYGLPFDFTDDDLDLLVDLTDGASPALLRGVMEGVKRALAVWPKLPRSTDDAAAVFAAVIAAVQPPPEMDDNLPELWQTPAKSLARLRASLSWPPARTGA